MTLPRRNVLRLVTGAAGLAVLSRSALAQTYPARPVRIVIGFPAGGSVDILVRILAEQFKDRLGQPFVVENRGGAGGNVGIAAVAGSPPDGYTIGAATVGQFAINQYLYERMPFDPERDIVPVSLAWELPNVLVVAARHVPARTVAEFITWARVQGRITFASPGVGTTPHLSAALFAMRTGLDATHVPFRGAAQSIPAMLAGDVTFALDNLASYTSVIESGQMRALAITSAMRWPALPETPTMAEAGLSDFVITSWGGFVVPAGTPEAIVDRLAAALKDIAADAQLQRRFLVAGAICLASTPAEARARAARERPMWREVVRMSGARAE
jgi:tripartite-type tricarboxylate transporter receptor subunit TctC